MADDPTASSPGSGSGSSGAATPDGNRHVRTRRHFLEIGGAVVVAVAVVLLIGWGLGWFSGTSTFSMPNVVGKSQSAATQTLQEKGLKVAGTDLVTSAQPQGTVTKTDPAPGDQVSSGGSVALFVAAAQVVPQLQGKTVTVAEAELKGAGLTAKVRAVQSDLPAGTVVDQNPIAGVRVKHGTQVGISVSTGKVDVVVPNVAGMTPAQAASALTTAGLVVHGQVAQNSATIGNGVAIGTNPAAGTTAQKGASVQLIVSSGPSQVVVQSVIGQQQDPATTTLSGQGFKVSVTSTASCQPAQHGTVVTQNPGAGALAPNGATVTIALCTATTSSTTTTTGGATTTTG